MRLSHLLAALAVPLVATSLARALEGPAGAPAITYADQGPQWTTGAREQFYKQDQGAQMIPYAWLKALKTADGKPFLDGALARYGYLPSGAPDAGGLPVGFTLAASPDGPMAGMTCAACHTRQITISGKPYRIDGGPALADFQTLLADLDAAAAETLKPDTFATFATQVLGDDAKNPASVAVLRADFTVWATRFHLIIAASLPLERPWGPSRLDAVSMILNRVTGLDIGKPPTYAIPDNIVRANAPTRYPFLWNASRQDHTQWPGFAANGNDLFALSRNLGEVYGVFGLFHPEATTGAVGGVLDRNYILHNSGNFGGLQTLEGLIKRIGPPAWKWAVDEPLAARGKVIYDTVRTGPANKTCNDCHGIRTNLGPDNFGTWQTPIQNVGTDQAEWRVLGRYASTGSLEGASIPFVVSTLLKRDLAVSVLKISVAGALAQQGVASVTGRFRIQSAATPDTVEGATVAVPGLPGLPSVAAIPGAVLPNPQLSELFRLPGMRDGSVGVAAAPPVNAYEARVMEGIWAAAPYLHNGSVPTLADLLKPAEQRPTSFAVGPAYDLKTLGLDVSQPGSTFTLHTTGCGAADLVSGDSHCGHEYGTTLPEPDKAALLEYLKTL